MRSDISQFFEQRLKTGYGSGAIGVHLVYLSRRQLPRAVSAFLDFATETVKGLGVIGR